MLINSRSLEKIEAKNCFQVTELSSRYDSLMCLSGTQKIRADIEAGRRWV